MRGNVMGRIALLLFGEDGNNNATDEQCVSELSDQLAALNEIRDYLWPEQTGMPNKHRNCLVAIQTRETLLRLGKPACNCAGADDGAWGLASHTANCAVTLADSRSRQSHESELTQLRAENAQLERERDHLRMENGLEKFHKQDDEIKTLRADRNRLSEENARLREELVEIKSMFDHSCKTSREFWGMVESLRAQLAASEKYNAAMRDTLRYIADRRESESVTKLHLGEVAKSRLLQLDAAIKEAK